MPKSKTTATAATTKKAAARGASTSKAVDKKQLASIRTLLSQNEWEPVLQGLELLRSTSDLALWATLADGSFVDEKTGLFPQGPSDEKGAILTPTGSEIAKRVRANYREVVALSVLSSCERLAGVSSLVLGSCVTLTYLTPLAGLPGLQRLVLNHVRGCDYHGAHFERFGCKALIDLTPLAGLTGLQTLKLKAGKWLIDLSPLAGLNGLQSLELERCSRLTDLSPLAGLTDLRSLNLAFCSKLTDLWPLAGLTSLRSLNLESCDELMDLTPLSGLTGLQSLRLPKRLEHLSLPRPLGLQRPGDA